LGFVIPVKSLIHPDILNQQPIDFAIDENGMFLAGCGVLWAVRGSDGADYIEMSYQADDCTDKMWLKQELVDRLKQRPSGNGFVLTAAL
jgi:hypothetical protein